MNKVENNYKPKVIPFESNHQKLPKPKEGYSFVLMSQPSSEYEPGMYWVEHPSNDYVILFEQDERWWPVSLIGWHSCDPEDEGAVVFKSEGDIDNLKLKQLWQSDKGGREWRDIPVFKEER